MRSCSCSGLPVGNNGCCSAPRSGDQLLGSPFQNRGQLQQELIARWQQVRLLDRPEPQGAPIIHSELQPLIGAGLPAAGSDGALEDLIALVRSEPLPALGEGRV